MRFVRYRLELGFLTLFSKYGTLILWELVESPTCNQGLVHSLRSLRISREIPPRILLTIGNAETRTTAPLFVLFPLFPVSSHSKWRCYQLIIRDSHGGRCKLSVMLLQLWLHQWSKTERLFNSTTLLFEVERGFCRAKKKIFLLFEQPAICPRAASSLVPEDAPRMPFSRVPVNVSARSRPATIALGTIGNKGRRGTIA